MNYFVAFIILGVFGTIVAGFLTIGSPRTAREQRFDTQRVSHLQMIQAQIVYYWQNKGELPPELTILQDDISGFRVPVDPGSGTHYEYRRISDASFQLCATFSRENSDGLSREDGRLFMPMRGPASMPHPGKPFGASEHWSHNAGRVCFDRTIDMDFYKPSPQRRPE